VIVEEVIVVAVAAAVRNIQKHGSIFRLRLETCYYRLLNGSKCNVGVLIPSSGCIIPNYSSDGCLTLH
jgi:hypothetical protein